MREVTLSVRGLDTLLFRDGRPFTDEPGGRAHTQIVPSPQTIAGFLRTRAGRRTNCATPEDWARVAEAIHVRGPLLCRNEEVLLAAPADVLVSRPAPGTLHPESLAPLRPWPRTQLAEIGAGADIPGGMRPMCVSVDAKPAQGFEYWTWSNMMRWLADELPEPAALERHIGPSVDERVHVAIDPQRSVSSEGMLFSTRMVAAERYDFQADSPASAVYSLLCRIESAEDLVAEGPGTLGGESRLAVLDTPSPDPWPRCPEHLAASLADATHVRMALATPAVFTLGWQPGWLDRTTKTGSPPGLPGVTLKLVAAAVARRQAVSGWDLTRNGVKPVRYCVPAGSVYFFEVVGGNPSLLATDGWLQPVSDDEETSAPDSRRTNNRNDGFGLALWGVWKEKEDCR